MQSETFKDEQIDFEILPDKAIQIGEVRNDSNKVYNNYTSLEKEEPSIPLLNVGEFKIYNIKDAYRVKPNELDVVMSKNNRVKALIDIGKVIGSTSIDSP